MTAYSLTGLSGMGTIVRCRSSKDAGIFNQPLPATDSSGQILIDIFGNSRTFHLTGKFSVGDSGYSSVSDFIAALEAIQTGSQTAKTFVNGKNGISYTVLVSNVEWNDEAGGINYVDYDLDLMEGTV